MAYLNVRPACSEADVCEVDLAVDVENQFASDDFCPALARTQKKAFSEKIDLENTKSK